MRQSLLFLLSFPLARGWQDERTQEAARNDEDVWPKRHGAPDGPGVLDANDVEGKHYVAHDKIAPEHLQGR